MIHREVQRGRTPGKRARNVGATPRGQVSPMRPPPCRVIATTGGPRRHAGVEVGPAGREDPRSRTAGRSRPSRRRRRRGAGPRRRGGGEIGRRTAGRRARRRPARGRTAARCRGPRRRCRPPRARRSGRWPTALLPSVATQSRPSLSIAQLSGMPNQPLAVVAVEKVAPTSATEGSPHCSRISQVPLVAAKSPPSSVISMMWPKALSARGLAASLVGLALGVVGQHHVDAAGGGVRLRCLRGGPSGSRRAGRRRGASRSARRPGSRSRSRRSAAPAPKTSGSHSIVPSASKRAT